MTGDLSWLPDRHLQAAASLAHADELIEIVGDIVFEYLRIPDGPIELTEVSDGAVSRTTIARVHEVPRGVALYTADVFTTLRAAIEHTLYAEVEYSMGSQLMTGGESRAVEMPAHATVDGFNKWARDRQKRAPVPLHPGSSLITRMSELQPYQFRNSPDSHPLKALVEHSNLAKHRMPAVAAAKVAAVRPDSVGSGIIIAPINPGPAQAGDVLATNKMGVRTPVTFFPSVSLQRPHTGEWRILVHELAWLSKWTRTVAIPILVTGSKDVPALPARYDTHQSHTDERSAIAAGTDTTALA